MEQLTKDCPCSGGHSALATVAFWLVFLGTLGQFVWSGCLKAFLAMQTLLLLQQVHLGMVLGGPGYVKDGRQGGHGHRASLSLVCLLVKEIFIPLLVTQKGSKALGRVGVRE